MKITKILLLTILAMLIIGNILSFSDKSTVPNKPNADNIAVASLPEDQIKFSDLISEMNEGRVLEVKLTTGTLYATMTDGKEFKCAYVDRETLMEALKENNITYYSELPNEASSGILRALLITILPILLLIGGMSLMQYFMQSRLTSKNVDIDISKNTNVTFKDIAGQDEAKESVMEIVNYLKNPHIYSKIGAKQPKGALLVGPPGTGKTLLAKAIAGEAGVSFISTSGSEFVEMFVGVGASRVRSLFKKARQNSPCIIFIDEIDAIGKKRSTGMSSSEHESTLTQILKEMDGFTADNNIVVLAATNQPEALDSALIRPGRFDRHIPLNNPDLQGRIDILKIHLQNVVHEDIDFERIALMIAGCSGADIANIVNEAAITAVRNKEEVVTTKHLEEAIEVVFAGKIKKSTILSQHEKSLVAHHEIGHALVAVKLKNTKPVQKITIIPRTHGALGFVMQTPEEEKFLQTKSELLNEITIALAGRCAEEIVFRDYTTGASNDIEKATDMARALVTRFGMSDKFGMIKLEADNAKYLNSGTRSICSEITMAEVDKEIMNIIQSCKDKATQILEDNKEDLSELASILIKEETITGDRFMEIIKRRL